MGWRLVNPKSWKCKPGCQQNLIQFPELPDSSRYGIFLMKSAKLGKYRAKGYCKHQQSLSKVIRIVCQPERRVLRIQYSADSILSTYRALSSIQIGDQP